MKYAWVAVVALCLVVTGAWAVEGAFSARSLGMGTASIAVADDAAAWSQNPAGLASLAIPLREGKEWANDLMVNFATVDEQSSISTEQSTFGDDDEDFWGATWSACRPGKMQGIGLGFSDLDSGKAWGVGVGAAIGDSPFAVGVNTTVVDFDGPGISEVLLNLGFMYRCTSLKLGVTVDDVTDETGFGPVYNAGAYWRSGALGIALDARDLSDQADQGVLFDAGAEYMMGAFALRVGTIDGVVEGNQFTAGVGYRSESGWRLDAAFADLEDGLWSVSGACNF